MTAGRTRIKICGLFRPCDIEYVNEAGLQGAYDLVRALV